MTVTDVTWLAAVLAPQDLAPHPNFQTDEGTTAASRLAALLAPWGRFRAHTESDGDPFYDACRDSLNSGSEAVGAQTLSNLIMSDRAMTTDQAVAGALLASVAFGELDDHDSAVGLLSSVLGTVRAKKQGPEEKLLAAALLQQRALRSFEMGAMASEDAAEVRELLTGLDLNTFNEFALSAGVSWSSQQTCLDMVAALNDAARVHLAHLPDAWSDGSWQEVVRARPSALLQKQARRRADGYQDYLAAQFQSAVATRLGSTEGLQRGEVALYQSLLFSELLGHPNVQNRRSELAVFRFLASQEDKQPFLQGDALRLFRQGRDKKRLSAALRRVRVAGPLEVIRLDALQVLERRVATQRLGDVELVLLQVAADFLTQREASLALKAVLSCVEDPFSIKDGSWHAEAVRLEDVWLAVVALAPVADRVDSVAGRLLREVGVAVTQDDLLDRMYARTIDSLDWSTVSTRTSAAWRQWTDDGGAGVLPLSMTAVRNKLRLPEALAGQPAGHDLGLEELTAILNAVINGLISWPEELTSQAQALVLSQMLLVRKSSAARSYSFGGIAAADVGVALALYAGVDCWSDIAGFLIDPTVTRADKTAALERMARDPAQVPASVVQLLSEGVDALLASAFEDFFGPPPVVPYPAGLRALGALEAITPERLLTECARLAGSSSAPTRIEAVRTLSTVTLRRQPYSWSVVFALQLSRDTDSAVRAEAARCLSVLLGNSTDLRELVVDRLVDLLSEDGVLVPSLVIRGLMDGKANVLTDRVIAKVIANLASSHPARSVRLLATEYVGSS